MSVLYSAFPPEIAIHSETHSTFFSYNGTLTAFNLDYFTEVLDLSYLLEHLPDSPFFRKYKKLNAALIGLVEDYSLVSFVPLSVQVSGSLVSSATFPSPRIPLLYVIRKGYRVAAGHYRRVK